LALLFKGQTQMAAAGVALPAVSFFRPGITAWLHAVILLEKVYTNPAQAVSMN
jgi:hypothetical protein